MSCKIQLNARRKASAIWGIFDSQSIFTNPEFVKKQENEGGNFISIEVIML